MTDAATTENRYLISGQLLPMESTQLFLYPFYNTFQRHLTIFYIIRPSLFLN